MASKDVLRRFEIDDSELEKELASVLGEQSEEAALQTLTKDHTGDVRPDSTVVARVLAIQPEANKVLVDIGGKAEAPIPLDEFEDGLPAVGETFEVFYQGDDRQTSVPVVSKREADRERAWAKVVNLYEPGDIIEGEVKKKIKGGLLVNVEGVLVFLPASQIDIRRTPEPGDFLNTTIRCKIVKIDEERRNIVVSRRQLLEEERMEKRENLLKEIDEGQVRKGEVKNIADFGAFVDLGGMDGLLHVTDMSYGRIKHPREMVKIGDVIDVYVLKIDRDRNRVALSLKALHQDPWEAISERYPVSSVHTGRIANIVPYGLFVELEPGVEGLVHVSELSWTRQNLNPEGEYNKGEEIQIFVKAIDLEKKEMSLSVREVEGNPWDRIAENYHPGTVIEATVKNLASYGAFVEIEEGIDGLLHNTDFHWTRKVQHPSEMVRKGDRIQCVVLAVDKEKQRISLGMKQLTKNPWEDYIPANYHVGDVMAGAVTKNITSGAFVKLEEELEAFMHFSTLPQEWQGKPDQHCIPGLKVEVRVVRVDCGEERIGLAFLHADFEENDEVIAKWKEAQERKKARAAARAAAKAQKEDDKEAKDDGDEAKAEGDQAEVPTQPATKISDPPATEAKAEKTDKAAESKAEAPAEEAAAGSSEESSEQKTE
ncbi:MAG: 30S ribosomal protein S1 [Planctomycetota bacterium]|nr:MAG: 30S ribosomal protein S1 [Planctomycetota bacterium]